MASMLKHHHELTNGVGKCSVPMWMNGCPAGFCDKEAYGRQTQAYRDRFKMFGHVDPRYRPQPAYAPGLACLTHGGPPPTHFGDPCIRCGIPHDDVPVGPCAGNT